MILLNTSAPSRTSLLADLIKNVEHPMVVILCDLIPVMPKLLRVE